MKMEPSADLEKDARCSVQEILAAIDTGSSSSGSSSSGNSSSSMDLTTEERGFGCLLLQ